MKTQQGVLFRMLMRGFGRMEIVVLLWSVQRGVGLLLYPHIKAHNQLEREKRV